jgi:hypothetical protein
MKIFSLLFALLLFASSLTFSQDNKARRITSAYDDGSSYALNRMTPAVPFVTHSINPVGTVTNLITFADYVTNGNNLRKVAVFGDTVVVTADYLDSAAALTTRTIRYNVSYNGGNTWGTDVLIVSTIDKMAYGDLSPVILSTGRSVAISGRQYAPGSRAFAGADLVIGTGVFTTTLNTNLGQDYFSQRLNANELGGMYRSADSLFFVKYNYVNNSYGTRSLVATTPDADASSRWSSTTSSDGQGIFGMWYLSVAPEEYKGRESTNGGTSFGSVFTILPTGMLDGDSVTPWLNLDPIYKPGTMTKCAAVQTVPTGTNRRGYKIVFWSPATNSGNPVVVADYRSSTIPILYDSLTFQNDTGTNQVNMSAVSNPSIAFTDNGSRLICVFEVTQPELSSYAFNYHDIYSSYSDNNGATWSTPINLTNTSALDEIFVTIAKTGNSANNVGMVFQVSECPGSSSFNQTSTPQCPVYWVYRRYDPVTGNLIGVKSVSGEIPNSFSLQQNYPNPFNPSTNIRFDMPKNDYVTLKVYDIIGREIRTLLKNEYVSAGVKEVVFDGSDVASGVYFYRIEAGDFKATKKMMLVK